MAERADITAAVGLLRAEGYSVTKPTGRGCADQRLWVCTWGTMMALVWATSAENAEHRVRHGVFDRKATTHQVLNHPMQVSGEVLVRAATDDDLVRFDECGGTVPA